MSSFRLHYRIWRRTLSWRSCCPTGFCPSLRCIVKRRKQRTWTSNLRFQILSNIVKVLTPALVFVATWLGVSRSDTWKNQNDLTAILVSQNLKTFAVPENWECRYRALYNSCTSWAWSHWWSKCGGAAKVVHFKSASSWDIKHWFLLAFLPVTYLF